LKIVLAELSHETNTYSTVPTDLARFSGASGRPSEGEKALNIYRDTASCLGGYIKVCESGNHDIVLAVAGGAAPSGPVFNEAYEYISEKILAAINAGCDAIMLDLHGAMVTQMFEDGEGELLRRIRKIAPEIPLALCLDMHANIYPDMVNLATIVCGYHTYPHVDMDKTAERAGTLLLRTIAGEINPKMVWGNVPMLPHVMRQGTDDSPNKELQARAVEMEKTEALAVSLFTGFPHADIENAGLSVVAVVDNNIDKAKNLRDELLENAWNARATFVYTPEPLIESVVRAKVAGERNPGAPVLILDHYDNTASGGTMDTTEVLAEILRQNLKDVAVFAIYDPEAAQAIASAGVGNEVKISLGAKLPMPALEVQSKPLELTGRVKLISDGVFTTTVAMSRGLEMNMGLTVVLTVAQVDIVIISRHVEPYDPGVFTSLGIVPAQRRYLMLKSRIHYRVGFRDLVAEVVECAGCGVCTSDYSQIEFKNVRRPIYPLDGDNFT